MKLKFVFGLFPVFVFFVDSLGELTAGEARGPVVRILKSYADDAGLLEHELTHARQWYTLGLLAALVALVAQRLGCQYWQITAALSVSLHSVLYAAVTPYRLWAEVQAYKIQARYYLDDRLEMFAGFISTRYGLNVSQGAALNRLRGN